MMPESKDILTLASVLWRMALRGRQSGNWEEACKEDSDMIKIRIGTENDKRKLIGSYPNVKNVIGENGYLLLAEDEIETVGFLWAFKRKIQAPVEQEELFIKEL